MKGRDGAATTVPDLHFHINHYDACLTLDLFAKSSLVPALPELRLGVPAVDDPTFTVASNFRRESRGVAASGPGRFGSRCTPFSEDGPAVQILTPAAAVDALVYLACGILGRVRIGLLGQMGCLGWGFCILMVQSMNWRRSTLSLESLEVDMSMTMSWRTL